MDVLLPERMLHHTHLQNQPPLIPLTAPASENFPGRGACGDRLEQMPRGEGEDGQDDHESGGNHASRFGESNDEDDDQRGHEPVSHLEWNHTDGAQGEDCSEPDGGVERDFAAGLEITHNAAKNEENDVDPKDGDGIHVGRSLGAVDGPGQS